MKRAIISTFIFSVFLAFKGASAVPLEPEKLNQTVLDMLKNLLTDNEVYTSKHNETYFKNFQESQHPRSVIVSCSDSRFHVHSIDTTPDNDIFIIRNIGNQLNNNLGSIDYAIKHLHTPVLVIVGHSGCGAVKAATVGIQGLESTIQQELRNLKVPIKKVSPTKEEWATNIEANLDNQVKQAMTHYATEIGSGTLVVVGAVYNFHNPSNQNNGELTILSINGQKDPALISKVLQLAKERGVYPAAGK
jgi:carbonic anhydrase